MEGAKVAPDLTFAGPRRQFFNPASGIEADAVTQAIAWTAFPRPVQIASASDEERWALADQSRADQVEYCEWSVESDAAGKVTRITFTCEDREYWRILAESQPDTALALYRAHVSPQVQPTDLFTPAGRYIPANRWNANTATGAMHMIAAPNTIGAAIELTAGASVARARADGTPLTGARELILCGRYGDPERHSDPTIGEGVNALVRQGHVVSIANPPELAFESVSFAGWETPDGSDPADWWRFTRGADGRHVRGVVAAPEGSGLRAGDLRIDGRELAFGGQVADGIRIKVVGLAHRLGQITVDPLTGCLGDPPPAAGMAGPEAAAARPRARLRRI
jgi:hypothetical protein